MKRLSLLLAPALGLALCASAHAEIYKCTSPQGHVTYASVPCPPNQGVTTVQRQGPGQMARPEEPEGHAHQVVLKALDFLKFPTRSVVHVHETESYKAHQRNRLPPPTVPSQCKGTNFHDNCFDPSAGQSSLEEARRRAANKP